ncbi:hypothetical protein CRG98_019170 [Punica granatum]|uniref:Uncharacterized protein n=1 Tax=Punica granatum TaxID=22663 RepID=A0A2I0JVT5_PUNGR|nr:hypothetical protein CRG98_019170 [Punica granatum]
MDGDGGVLKWNSRLDILKKAKTSWLDEEEAKGKRRSMEELRLLGAGRGSHRPLAHSVLVHRLYGRTKSSLLSSIRGKYFQLIV